MQNQPLYAHSHVNMLLAAATIIENAKANKDFLQAKRAVWTDAFFDDLTTRIDTATSTYLGVDSLKGLRSQTLKVNEILAAALLDLAEVKVQIEVDYTDDPPKKDELLNKLGFKDYHARALSRDQEAAISLLYQFEKNLDAATKADFIMKGISDELLESTVSHSLKLKNANISQEVQKGASRAITDQAAAEFNDIYKKAIGIAKISRRFYQGNPVKMDQFSFTKIVRALNSFKPKKDKQAA